MIVAGSELEKLQTQLKKKNLALLDAQKEMLQMKETLQACLESSGSQLILVIQEDLSQGASSNEEGGVLETEVGAESH